MSPAAAFGNFEGGGKENQFFDASAGQRKKDFWRSSIFFLFCGGQKVATTEKISIFTARQNFFWQVNFSVFFCGELIWRSVSIPRPEKNSTTHSRTLKSFPTIFFEREFNMQSVQNLEKNNPNDDAVFFSPSVKFAMSHFLTLSPCIGKMMATTAPLYSFFLRSSSISISLAFLPTFHNCLYGRRKGGKDC